MEKEALQQCWGKCFLHGSQPGTKQRHKEEQEQNGNDGRRSGQQMEIAPTFNTLKRW